MSSLIRSHESIVMTNTPELTRLNHDQVRGVLDAHRLWCASGGSEGADAQFELVVIEGFDFSDVELTMVHFNGAVLERCRFDGSILHDSDFSDAKLSGSSFRRADLVRALLWNADVRDCVFDDGNLARVEMLKANLTGASFRRADLNRALISRCQLDGAVFDGAELGMATIDENVGAASWQAVVGQPNVGSILP